MMPRPDDVLEFWFAKENRPFWFEQNDTFDRAVVDRLVPLLDKAGRGNLDQWLDHAEGALALVLLLDQVPRNAFRGSPRAYEYDDKARRAADIAIQADLNQTMSVEERAFLYLPFEHSEDLDDQVRSVALMATLGDDRYDDYARRHQVIIERFGRFPHRNVVLGRASTPEELAFLKEPDSSF